jgi:hypothetical protein
MLIAYSGEGWSYLAATAPPRTLDFGLIEKCTPPADNSNAIE